MKLFSVNNAVFVLSRRLMWKEPAAPFRRPEFNVWNPQWKKIQQLLIVVRSPTYGVMCAPILTQTAHSQHTHTAKIKMWCYTNKTKNVVL